MRLNYKILWIDDQFEDGIDASIDSLEFLLFENGFKLEVKKIESLDDESITDLANSLDKYNQYDFIIFDYDLGQGHPDGVEIAKKLRDKIYTDMIFYSSVGVPKLRELLYDKKVDGVFLVDRTDFENQIRPIIMDHIKRMSDLNNMRGLLLDEMSQCDAQIRKMLVNKWEQLNSEVQLAQENKLRDTLAKRFNENLNEISGDNKLNFPELAIKYQITDFESIRRRLKTILKSNLENKEWLEDSSPLKRSQNLRNDFAHKESISHEDHITLGSKDYDHTRFLEIRKDLIQMKNALEASS